jgi:mercuric ion transport protein
MSTDSSHKVSGGKALIAGGLSALFASACCLGPLVLLMLGVSGAWISSLTLLEPYQPLFIGVAIVALFFAARRIWHPVAACEPGQVCQRPAVNRAYKALFAVALLLPDHDQESADPRRGSH